MEGADRDAGHVLRTDLHLGQEAVDQVNGREQDVVRQFVPDLEATQHVRCPVPGSDGDLAILRDGCRIVIDGGGKRREERKTIFVKLMLYGKFVNKWQLPKWDDAICLSVGQGKVVNQGKEVRG